MSKEVHKSKQIEYRIGYRKGTIHLDDHGKVIKDQAASEFPGLMKAGYFIERCVWGNAPTLPNAWWVGFMFASPAIIFTLTLILLRVL
jgi:hypothetical protein